MQSFRPTKRAWIIFGLAALVTLGAALAAVLFLPGAQGGSEGFRAMKWGSSIQEASGMTLLGEDGNLKFYQKQDDSLKIEDTEVDRIVYGYYKDRFYSVMAYFSAAPNFSKLKDDFFKQRGAPYQGSLSEKRYFWSDSSTDLLLTFDEASNKGRLSLFFKPIQEKMGKDGATAAGDTAKEDAAKPQEPAKE